MINNNNKIKRTAYADCPMMYEYFIWLPSRKSWKYTFQELYLYNLQTSCLFLKCVQHFQLVPHLLHSPEVIKGLSVHLLTSAYLVLMLSKPQRVSLKVLEFMSVFINNIKCQTQLALFWNSIIICKVGKFFLGCKHKVALVPKIIWRTVQVLSGTIFQTEMRVKLCSTLVQV